MTRLEKWIDVAELPGPLRHSFDLAVAPLADGSWLTLPVQVLIGSRPKPRLVAIAGVHGDEPDGMLALLDFAERTDPVRLRGTIVLIPVANPPAFAAHQRRSPLDGLDLNRIFPGRPDGTPSERLAFHLVHDIIAGAELVFTLHSWYATGMVVDHVEVPDGENEVSRRSCEAAVAAGFRRIRRSAWQAGVLGVTVLERGIPVLEAEIGGQGVSTVDNRAAYVEHVTQLARHLGIFAGEVPVNANVEVLGRGLVHAPAGGMLRLQAGLGDYVAAGALLAVITNLHGERLAEIRAPHGGLVAAVRRFVSVNPGEVIFALYPGRDRPP